MAKSLSGKKDSGPKQSLNTAQMVAALLRVVYGGLQDSRIIPRKGQPNIAFFKKVFIRAGRFTTQFVRLDFDTRPAFGATSVITLPRKGHLISRLYLVTTLPDISTVQTAAAAYAASQELEYYGPTFGWTNSLGHALLQQATIEIGGARVEQIDGRLLEVMDDFNTPLEKVELVNKLLKRDSSTFSPTSFGATSQVQAVTPLPFWFSRGDMGAVLPIDALYADPVKLSIGFSPVQNLYVSTARRVPTSLAGVPAAGDAYYPLVGSPFYYNFPGSGVFLPGLTGDPNVSVEVAAVPGLSIPNVLTLGDTYIMAEYIYLDGPEANRFRVADIQIPTVQHYAFEPVDTVGSSKANCYLKIPNPTRNLYFYLQRFEAPVYNAPFLATRDLSGVDAPQAPWWPNASVIDPSIYKELVPAFVFRDSEPIQSLALVYEGKLFRYSTNAPSLYRSLIPSFECKKSPWVNRYMYMIPFSLNSGHLPPSQPSGEANLDKIVNINLQLEMNPFAGASSSVAVPRYIVYIWAETYNIFRVYGGRGGMMFGY